MQDTRLNAGGEAPLSSYRALSATFAAGLTGLCAFSLLGRRFDRPLGAGDMLLLGAATHKLSRLITRDRVAMPLRAPFAKQRDEGRAGSGLHEEPAGHGMRRAIGELLTCPFCVAPWITLGLLAGHSVAPAPTRAVTTLFSVAAISDAFNLGYARLKPASEGG